MKGKGGNGDGKREGEKGWRREGTGAGKGVEKGNGKGGVLRRLAMNLIYYQSFYNQL
ncbi:MAG: hypothetical protein ACK5ZX_01600 [Bacteroidota bacterium]